MHYLIIFRAAYDYYRTVWHNCQQTNTRSDCWYTPILHGRHSPQSALGFGEHLWALAGHLVLVGHSELDFDTCFVVAVSD